MIMLLTCDCGGAEEMVRRPLKKAGVEDWLGVPLRKGATSVKLFLDQLPEEVQETVMVGALRELLESKSNYAVVFGWDETGVTWTNVSDGTITSPLDAEAIVERFA